MNKKTTGVFHILMLCPTKENPAKSEWVEMWECRYPKKVLEWIKQSPPSLRPLIGVSFHPDNGAPLPMIRPGAWSEPHVLEVLRAMGRQ